MIDLTKEQVLAEPVKAFVWNDDVTKCDYRWLIGIRSFGDGLHCYCLINVDANKSLSKGDVVYTPRRSYKNCSLTDPTAPTKRIKKWETIEDVPPELWGRALVKHKKERPCLAVLMSPCEIVDCEGLLLSELHYLPLGQPLTGEWLPFESEVVE